MNICHACYVDTGIDTLHGYTVSQVWCNKYLVDLQQQQQHQQKSTQPCIQHFC